MSHQLLIILTYFLYSAALLSCGLHACSSKCHQIYDHSKMTCEHIMYWNCPKGHQKPWKCHVGPPDACSRCAEDVKIAEKRQKAAFLAQEKAEREQREHDRRMAELEADIEKQRVALRNRQLAEERDRAYELRQRDLRNMAAPRSAPPPLPIPPSPGSSASTPEHSPMEIERPDSPSQPTQLTQVTSNPAPSNPSLPTPAGPPPRRRESEAEKEWMRQKQVDGASNPAIDSVMEMGGLEKVKQEILNIKAKAEVTQRQGSSLKRERFSVSMLGNPGTGKIVSLSQVHHAHIRPGKTTVVM
jgi:hypothetical protein